MLIFLFKGFMEVNNALLNGRFFLGGVIITSAAGPAS